MKQTARAKENSANYYTIIKSPIDDLLLVADDSALTGLYFVGYKHIPAASKGWTRNKQHPILCQAAKQLQEYFSGKREKFSVPLRLGGTDFQEKIWKKIASIPYGKTVSYTILAKQAGSVDAIRAAGTATGRNPISIIIPCHRVVGKDGSLHGFAGGLDRKRHLLEIEGLLTKTLKK